jgi:hypothetical protein
MGVYGAAHREGRRRGARNPSAHAVRPKTAPVRPPPLPVRYASLPLHCYCNSGVTSQHWRGTPACKNTRYIQHIYIYMYDTGVASGNTQVCPGARARPTRAGCATQTRPTTARRYAPVHSEALTPISPYTHWLVYRSSATAGLSGEVGRHRQAGQVRQVPRRRQVLHQAHARTPLCKTRHVHTECSLQGRACVRVGQASPALRIAPE